MEIEKIKAAIEEASKDLKSGVAGAQDVAQKALENAKTALESLEQKASATDVEDLKKKFEEEKLALQKDFDELAASVKNSAVVEKELKSIMAQLKTQFEAKQDDLKMVHNQKAGVVSFSLKAASDPIGTGSFGDRVIFGLREPGVTSEPLPQRFVFDIIEVMNGGAGSNPLSWVEAVPAAGAPAFVAENADKPAMNWTYVENKVTAEMIAVWTAVTRQALLNWPILEQEIRSELSRKLYNKLDQAVIAGDGTNNSIYGIKHYATDFAAGSLAGTITNAGELDVLRVAIGQVRKGAAVASADLGGFIPNFALVSVDTATALDLQKDKNGAYLLPPFTSNDGTRIKGVQIIETNFVEEGEFIVGDFSKYLFNIVDGLRIDLGYVNDQFIKNQLTVRAEMYGMGRVKDHEKPAFVKGDFATAIAELEATT